MPDYERQLEIYCRRDYKVVKANKMIQLAKNDLSLQELKIFAYCVSMIKPTDSIDTQYEFSIKEYCAIAGINWKSGNNYIDVKKSFTNLLSKTFWMINSSGVDTSIHWLEKVSINRGKGTMRIAFDKDLQEYIFGLFENYTQYELLCTLPMTSRYSFKLFELLHSYAFTKSHEFELEELKGLLGATHYVNFKDFRRKVLEIAIKEINLYSDIEVSYEPVFKGRKVVSIIFHINKKDVVQAVIAKNLSNNVLDGQMSIEDFLDV